VRDCEYNNTLGIFLNCSNIHYLLRVIYSIGHTFQLFHTFENCVQILDFNKITRTKKESRQNSQGLHIFYIFSSLTAY
jgi:hypothetical protein